MGSLGDRVLVHQAKRKVREVSCLGPGTRGVRAFAASAPLDNKEADKKATILETYKFFLTSVFHNNCKGNGNYYVSSCWNGDV